MSKSTATYFTTLLSSYIGTWEKRYETDSPLCVRRMASARIIEISMHWSLDSHCFMFSSEGIWGYLTKKHRVYMISHALRNGICNHDGFELRAAESGQGRPTQDSVHAEGIDFAGSGLVKPKRLLGFKVAISPLLCSLFGRQTNRPTCVSHVIDEDGHSVFHVTYKRHLLHLVRSFALLVN